MATRKTTYLILGIVFLVLNTFTTLQQLSELKKYTNSDAFSIGYILGSQIFLYVAAVFLYLYYRLNKKMKAQQKQQLENNIAAIGNKEQ